MSWKDKFAASKFWNHKIAEKITSICGQNGFQIRPHAQSSSKNEFEIISRNVLWSHQIRNLEI